MRYDAVREKTRKFSKWMRGVGTYLSNSLIGLSGAVADLTSFSTRPLASFSSSARTIRIVDLDRLIPLCSGSAPGIDSRASTGRVAGMDEVA